MSQLTQHFEDGLLRLHLFALSVYGGVLPERGRLPYPQTHAHVQEDHYGHGHDEEQQRGEFKQERRRRLNRAERRFRNRLEKERI